MNKKYIGIFICTLLVISSALTVAGNVKIEGNNCIDEIKQKPGINKIPINLDPNDFDIIPVYKSSKSSPPIFDFIKEPTAIFTSYYDYMPGSYNGFPIRTQTENGDGKYLTYHGQSTKTGTRKQYYAYIDSSYNIQNDIIYDNNRQGYGGIVIHPKSGNCIASWHEDINGDEVYETGLTFDDFDSSETAGNWQTPVYLSSPGSNEYIWPYLYSGPSPQGDGYIRIYQITSNFVNTPGGLPCEDVKFSYIDVENINGADLSIILNSDNWEYTTIFTDWREKSIRPFQSFAIDYNNPGKVAFIGNAAWLDGDQGNMPVEEGIFVWESYDYGETWDYSNLHTYGQTNYLYLVENTPGIDFDGTVPDNLEVGIFGYHSTALFDGDGNLHYSYLQSYGYTDNEGLSYYLPSLLPQAEAVWDGSSFIFHEVPALPGTDSLSGHTVPWDGATIYTTIGWSTYPSGEFHENCQKQAINRENNWMLHMWVDGTYSQLAREGDEEYEDYIKHPIIFISISNDNGNTWSDPIELTDVHSDLFNFSEQVTVYPYVSDEIIDLGDGWGQVDLYYFDDNEFGSSVQGGIARDKTGQITYCAIRIKFAGDSPQLEIGDITGGIGVSTSIKNTGSAEANNVQWTITLEGQVFLGGESTGTISNILAGETATIKSKFPLGFGDINIQISVQSSEGVSATKSASGKIILFFIQI